MWSIYAIVTGMGFISYDAIFKGNNSVKRMATAACLWSTTAIKISVAYACYEITSNFYYSHFAIKKVQ